MKIHLLMVEFHGQALIFCRSITARVVPKTQVAAASTAYDASDDLHRHRRSAISLKGRTRANPLHGQARVRRNPPARRSVRNSCTVRG